jgi:hypothetical protein
VVTRPTPVQQKTFDLLGLALSRVAGGGKDIFYNAINGFC